MAQASRAEPRKSLRHPSLSPRAPRLPTAAPQPVTPNDPPRDADATAGPALPAGSRNTPGPRLRCGGQEITLKRGEAVILGSDPRCALCPHPGPKGLAAKHLRLAWVGPRVRVEALPGASLLVQGVPVQLATADPGDAVLAADQTGAPLVAVLVLPPAEVQPPKSLPAELPPEEAARMFQQLEATSAAAAVSMPVTPPTSTRSPGREATGFSELMAEELRRAPWFTLSLLLHGVALLLLVWLLSDQDEKDARPPAQFAIARDHLVERLPPEIQPEDGPVETELPPEDEMPLDALLPEEPVPEVEVPVFETSKAPADKPTPGAWEAALATSGTLDPIRGRGARGLSKGFRKTVAGLRDDGFELVFVFDTTQSMGNALEDTKQQLAHQLDVVHSLVPRARFGLVTYRDDGPREEYLTQSIPLAQDPFRALNFVEVAEAHGGGDLPEAVLEGLEVAMEQPWGLKARRAIVLVGDAPPHEDDLPEIRKLVTRFASGANCRVHTVVTVSSRRTTPNEDALETFKKIARWGQGQALVQTEGDDRLLARLLSLAFGRTFAGDLAQVDRMVAASRGPTNRLVRRLATGEDPEQLLAALRKQPVDAGLIQELVERPRRAAADALAESLGRRAIPARTRHVAAWCLQRILDLPVPPIDPVSQQPLRKAEVRKLRDLCQSQLAR